MTKPTIRSYADLLEEQARLELELMQHRENIRLHWSEVKENVSPVIRFLSFVKRWSDADKPSMLGRGLNLVFDLWLRKKLFRKTGWFTGMAGSFLLRRLTATIFSPHVWEQIKLAMAQFGRKRHAKQESKPY